MDDNGGRDPIRRHGDDLAMSLRIEHIVRTLTEIEEGRRPVNALDPLASPMVARRIRAAITEQRRSRRPRPPRDGSTRIISTIHRRPTVGAAEGSVVVRSGERSRSYVVRLEQEGDRWRIVELASPASGLTAARTRASIEGRLPEDENGFRRSSGRDGAGFFANLPYGPVMRITPDDPAYQDPGTVARQAEWSEDDDRSEGDDLD